MITWTKNPPINVGKIEHYRTLQTEIREEFKHFWTDNMVCKCSGDVVPLLIFFDGMNRESISEIHGEFIFGTSYNIKYIITPELNNQIDMYVDDKLLTTIKII